MTTECGCHSSRRCMQAQPRLHGPRAILTRADFVCRRQYLEPATRSPLVAQRQRGLSNGNAWTTSEACYDPRDFAHVLCISCSAAPVFQCVDVAAALAPLSSGESHSLSSSVR